MNSFDISFIKAALLKLLHDYKSVKVDDFVSWIGCPL